jgi:peptide/nickel transport system ATP-binding protein
MNPQEDPTGNQDDYLVVRGVSKRFQQRGGSGIEESATTVLVASGASFISQPEVTSGMSETNVPNASPVLGKTIIAVDHISLRVRKGEVVGLVGESGSGKTTLGKIIVNLVQPDSGELRLEGQKIVDHRTRLKKVMRRKFSMVFQDPYESLNPVKKVFDIVAFPARVNGKRGRELEHMVFDTLNDVKLTPAQDFASKYPHQLSGGQRQRVAIARSVILRPNFIVLDEPTSMLDASLKVGMINLISEILKSYSITAVLITHDLAVAAKMCSRLVVMYRGTIVEDGPCEEVIVTPSHPYTKSLISAIPQLGQELQPLTSAPKMENVEAGKNYCKYYRRCRWAFDRCVREEPEEYAVGSHHYSKCFLYDSPSK